MKRFILGCIVGLVLGAVSLSWAGFSYSPVKLVRQRGSACGESFVLGYVAGVFDLMAGVYPVTGGNLGEIRDAAWSSLLTSWNDNAPAAWWVVDAMLQRGHITREDAIRILPADWIKQLK